MKVEKYKILRKESITNLKRGEFFLLNNDKGEERAAVKIDDNTLIFIFEDNHFINVLDTTRCKTCMINFKFTKENGERTLHESLIRRIPIGDCFFVYVETDEENPKMYLKLSLDKIYDLSKFQVEEFNEDDIGYVDEGLKLQILV